MDNGDYSVYEVEPPPANVKPRAASSARQSDEDYEDTMYFTSVDRNSTKKPRRPVNPKSKQRKGFLSKLFSRNDT
jgi:hypothetical protein